MNTTHKNMQLVQGRTHIEKARQLAGQLGMGVAARYLKNRGWSLQAASYILLGK